MMYSMLYICKQVTVAVEADSELYTVQAQIPLTGLRYTGLYCDACVHSKSHVCTCVYMCSRVCLPLWV